MDLVGTKSLEGIALRRTTLRCMRLAFSTRLENSSSVMRGFSGIWEYFVHFVFFVHLRTLSSGLNTQLFTAGV